MILILIVEEIEWHEINEEVEVDLDSVEQMVDNFCDYSIDTVGTVLAPVTYLCLQLFYFETLIGKHRRLMILY